jgi:hypothetical protein
VSRGDRDPVERWRTVGGAGNGTLGVTWPFAWLSVTCDRAQIRVVPGVRWLQVAREDVAALEPTDASGQSFRFRLIDGGTARVHFSPARPGELVDAVRVLGWTVDE